MSFFFFKQKTAYELRISDWSSDVCSSDLDEGSDWFAPSNLEVTDLSVGNTATNVIPGEARARLNIRFNDLHTGAALVEWIRTTASRAEERRVGKEGARTGRSRWWRNH